MIERTPLSIEFYSPASEVKLATNAQGVVEGYASTFGGEPDSYGHIIAHGAFAWSLSQHKGRRTTPAMLWNHDIGQPIGKWLSMTEDAYGLKVTGKLTMESPRAREAFALAKDGALALSIGFRRRKDRLGSDNTRILQELDLAEISLVSLPANTNARITAVKSASEIRDPRAFEEFLREAGFPRAFAKAITASGFKAAAGLCDAEGERKAKLAQLIRASSNSISTFAKDTR